MSAHPIIQYADPETALAWLERAFGFETTAMDRDEEGVVRHAELRAGGTLVMVAVGEGSPGQGWTYVAVPEVDELHARAVAAGAEITMPLTDQDYGSRDFAARDPDGNRWSFGTYQPA